MMCTSMRPTAASCIQAGETADGKEKPMKRWIAALTALAMLFTVSIAAENTEETVILKVQGLLTEVYGYTQEEADGFTFDISDEDGAWAVRFYQNPAWVYQAEIAKADRSFISYQTPFSTLHYNKASENSVRYMLREMKSGAWFADWSVNGKKALGEALDAFGDIRINIALERGLQTVDYTPAQALDDFFLSCYGHTAQRSPETVAWRDAVFAEFGLTRETTEPSMPHGITEYTVYDMGVDGSTICEFYGTVPDTLAQAFSHPALQGWVCLAGAYQARNKAAAGDMPSGAGLAAFGRGEKRLLVMLLQDNATLAWNVLPVGETALYLNRDLYIRYSGSAGRFDIVYPVSDTEIECFSCRLVAQSSLLAYPKVCELKQYYRVNESGYSMTVVDSETNRSVLGWYHVVTTQNGEKEEALYPALAPVLMEYIDVSEFPTTDAACREAAKASPVIPEGYGFSSGVHLRAKTSSHSKDLGKYQPGTLVQVLDIQPGTNFPWYHVRVGVAEGYMSGNGVAYQENQPGTIRHVVLSVGKLKNDTALKQSTGIFASTVAELPAGTLVRVLADQGNWLHVSVPPAEFGWLMQPGETDGYIKKNAVVLGTTPMQLEWLTLSD